MKYMKIGVLGAGHMGSAIIKGLVNKYDPHDIFVKGHHVTSELKDLSKTLGFTIVDDDFPSDLNVLFVTTPAPITVSVLKNTKLPDQTVIVSAAQGVTEAEINAVHKNNSVVCIVPNIPVAVNAGCIAVGESDHANEDDVKTALKVVENLGTLIKTSNQNLGIVGTVAGCGPAFVDVFMDALADAAVQNGLNRETAFKVAASMVQGSGKLALDTGISPATLKDQVTSPGGSTIKGVVALDATGFRNAVNKAVNDANQ
ncbi:pyrroline-5-carboxylate reductase [Fructilactobacillus fructivorans]|nr:pyrroline-5-carboxylate reductase [Fructilactobacillus fructivorans]KRN40858.1 pyrroline-5-carboxylate reductase [Fructilactobacillus fructivorans]KRN42452.1 pyrroline-5-carboxylate reductase [Fructilactobacillus fructivorans]